MRVFALLIICMGLSAPSYAQDYPLSVQASFMAMGKVYVDFDPTQTNIRGQDAHYINALFELTDEAVRANYFMIDAYNMGGHEKHFDEKYSKTIDLVMAGLSEIDAPSETLQKVETLVTEAIFAQYKFFSEVKITYKGSDRIALNREEAADNENMKTLNDKILEIRTLMSETYIMEKEKNRQAINFHINGLSLM